MLYMTFIELVSFLKPLAFIRIHQYHPVHHSYCLSQIQCLHNSHPLSHIQCQHFKLFFIFQENIIISIYCIRYIAFYICFDCNFCMDLVPWSWSNGKAVQIGLLYLPIWCQNMVSCREWFRIQLFQMICTKFIHYII
jgi:hypothetical protein